MDVVEIEGSTVAHPGGSPMNVSLGLARLGIPVTFGTALGDDEFGHAISAHLEGSGVRMLAGPEAGRRTSSARVTLDSSGVPEYLFDVDWTPDFSAVSVREPIHVHIGSIGAFLLPGAEAVDAIVQAAVPTATVSYDPNIRPQFLSSPAEAVGAVERQLLLCDIVKASDEDVAWLYPGLSLEVVARHWRKLGPAIVVITRGGDGAILLCAAGELSVPGLVVDVVDSIGAGDAFMSGLIAGLHRRGLTGSDGRVALATIALEMAHEVLEIATVCGAMTVARAGAQPPRREDLPTGVW
ncbi:MAG: carbohydrate kinase family protein [Rhodoglobus sp.]